MRWERKREDIDSASEIKPEKACDRGIAVESAEADYGRFSKDPVNDSAFWQ